jgi:endonuclease G
MGSFKRLLPAALVMLTCLAALAQMRGGAATESAGGGAAVGVNAPGRIAPEASPHLLLGNPSNATLDVRNKDNYLMSKKYYALAYDSAAGVPLWVSWQLTKEDLGTAPRKRTFDDDATLPEGFSKITTQDYTGSGYDRGHLCPHSDRAHDTEMSYATFVMTNIIPQAPSLNQKAWNMLEMYLRDLVEKENVHLYVTAGPVYRGGWGSKGFNTTIANGKVVVPGMCWKIAVVAPAVGAGSELGRITPASRVIAVVMPNDNSLGFNWAQYRTSVDQIETITHLKFFDKLPPATAAALKSKVDTVDIPRQEIPVRGEEQAAPAGTN